MTVARVLAFVLAAATASSRSVALGASEDASGSTVVTSESREALPTFGSSVELLPIAASLVPGVVLHGSGAFARGDRDTAKRLLITEGLGLGTLASSIVVLAVTGASRRFTSILVPTAVTGAFLFVGSWLADIYSVSVPAGWRSNAPMHLPRLELSMVASYRYDPRSATDGVILPMARVALGRWLLGVNAQLAPSTSTSRIRGDVRYRLVKSGGSFVDLQAAITSNALGDIGVNVLSLEFAVPARLDLMHVGQLLRGGFVELSVGGLLSAVSYNRVDATETDSAMLVRGALGAYLGDGDGEVSIYYDHRRDTLAGGVILGGVAAGFAGYCGIGGTYYFSRNVGATATVELGSAVLAGLGVAMRFGESR
ncbi:MAG: hypothetical protein H7Z43_09975 [Clostridia bacterium]|nr:hypothetical protein [Deltaproteobacteria bacterium]